MRYPDLYFTTTQSGESSSTMESPSREIPSKNDGLLMTSSLESDAAPPSAFDLLIQVSFWYILRLGAQSFFLVLLFLDPIYSIFMKN
jgi:hypothetical protein